MIIFFSINYIKKNSYFLNVRMYCSSKLSRVYTVRTPVPPSVGVLYLFGQRSRGGFEPRPHTSLATV